MEKITRRFDIDFQPLSTACSLAMPSGDSAMQGYNAVTGDYEPDRSLIPLAILPVVTIDGANANARLAEMHWYRIVGGVRTEIICSGDSHTSGSHTLTAGFDVDTSSTSQRGKLTVSVNTPVDTTWTFEFVGKLLDPRTSSIAYDVRAAVSVRCVSSVAADKYELVLSAPATNTYNPLRDADMQRVVATLTAGGVAVGGVTPFLWEVPEGDGWRTLGTDCLDYWAEANGDYCIVNRKLMGDEARLRCTAIRPGVDAIDNVTRKIISWVRRIPAMRFDMAECPTTINPGQKSIAPKIVAIDAKGIVSGIAEHYAINWYLAPNNANGNPVWPSVPTACGEAPTISTANASPAYGGVVGVEVEDLGPLCAWQDSDGTILTDSNGWILLIK